MQVISTSELRTRSRELVATLLSGQVVSLIHRSKIIGKLKPQKNKAKIFDAQKMGKIVEKLNLKPLGNKEIEQRYRKHIMKRYGQDIPRH